MSKDRHLIRPMAAVVGCGVTWVLIVGFAFVIVIGIYASVLWDGHPLSQVFVESEGKFASPVVAVIAEASGVVFAFVGGWVAARLVRRARVGHAVASGVLVLAGSLVFDVVGDGIEHWSGDISYIGVVPAAAIGGVLAQRWRTTV